jgi:hypothetical protein
VCARKELRAWLTDPFSALVMGDVTLTLERVVDHEGRVAITLPDVRAWTLAPIELVHLKEQL